MDEYISREEVMSVIANMQEEHHYDAANLEDRYVVAHLLEVADKIKKLKAADVRPVKHGRWIPQGDDMWLCSNCKENKIFSMHESDRTEKQRYCCKCGARMDGDVK